MTDHRSQVGTTQHSRVAVIGAGVVGLSTALCIQNNIPSTSVTVIADRFIQDTLSFGAAGFFRPDENIGPTLSITREWFRATFRHYEILLHGNEAETAGIKRLSGYALSSSNQEKLVNGTMKELCVGLRPVDEQELRNFPPKYKYGIFYNSILADPRKYLKWLTDKILCNGGHIKNQSVKDLQDLRDFSVVVNCSGLRAKELAEDPLLTPVRGQVIKDAKVIEDWVGLRPFRQPIRIEAEVLGSGSNQCKVVHNYGHGAHGINTSWGTALHATRLVSDMLRHKMTSALAKL